MPAMDLDSHRQHALLYHILLYVCVKVPGVLMNQNDEVIVRRGDWVAPDYCCSRSNQVGERIPSFLTFKSCCISPIQSPHTVMCIHTRSSWLAYLYPKTIRINSPYLIRKYAACKTSKRPFCSSTLYGIAMRRDVTTNWLNLLQSLPRCRCSERLFGIGRD